MELFLAGFFLWSEQLPGPSRSASKVPICNSAVPGKQELSIYIEGCPIEVAEVNSPKICLAASAAHIYTYSYFYIYIGLRVELFLVCWSPGDILGPFGMGGRSLSPPLQAANSLRYNSNASHSSRIQSWAGSYLGSNGGRQNGCMITHNYTSG